jgi:hypothetical protein
VAIGDSLVVPVYQDAQHVISVCGNTVLTYSSESPCARYLEAWTRTVDLVAGQFHGALLALTIINPRAHAPDDISKAHIRTTVMRHASELKAFAYVVEGEGFGAAAVRSALSLISLAARYPFPLKVFGQVADAVPWMLSRPNQSTQPASTALELISVADALPGQLRAHVAAGA